MKLQCIHSRLKKCNKNVNEVCEGFSIPDDWPESEILKLPEYIEICSYFGDKLSFCITENMSDEECKKHLVEATLRWNYINKE